MTDETFHLILAIAIPVAAFGGLIWWRTASEARDKPPDKDDLELTSAIRDYVVQDTAILTFPQAIVAYRFPDDGNAAKDSASIEANIFGALLGVAAHKTVEDKLRDILAANPNADLKLYEKAIGIEIVSVERPNQKKPGRIMPIGDKY